MNPSDRNQSDEAVTKVLGALRTAEVPPGMEKRILKAIERSASALPGSRPRRRPLLPRVWFRRPEFTYSLAAVALFALALGLRTTHRHSSTPHPGAPANPRHATDPDARPRTEAKLTPQTTPKAAAAHLTPHPAAVSNPAPPAAAHPQPESFPAPEAPLTAQERLLLRIVHQGDPEEIAALNPTLRAAESAEDVAEFEEFFKPKIAIPPAPLPATINPATNQGDPNEPARP